jgi:ribosome-associated translation inhibitor RaiA
MIEHSLMLKGDLPAAAVQSWLERPLERLERRLGGLPRGPVHLRIALRAEGGKRRAQATLELSALGHHVAVGEDHPEARVALQIAFGELERALARGLGRRRARVRARRASAAARAEHGAVPSLWPPRAQQAQPTL